MNIISKTEEIAKEVEKEVVHIVDDTLYNADRTAASAFGAPPQETISSEIGEHDKNPAVDVAADALDAIQKNHVEVAEQHAAALDKADNGFEQ